MVDAAEKLKVKNVIGPECGHAYTALRWDGPNLLGRPYAFKVVHILELLDELRKQGRLQIGPESQVTLPTLSVDHGTLVTDIILAEPLRLNPMWRDGALVLEPATRPAGLEVSGLLTVTATADLITFTAGEARVEMVGPQKPDTLVIALQGPMAASSLVVRRD